MRVVQSDVVTALWRANSVSPIATFVSSKRAWHRRMVVFLRPLRRAPFLILFLLGLAQIAASPAQAQGGTPAYPARTMRIIVGFPPGSSNDILARFIATRLNERLGQPIVVDNRPGASGAIGAELAAKSSPDGHTLLLMTISNTMTPALRTLPFDPIRSFTPVALLGTGPLVLVAGPAFPANSVKELIDLAKAKPGVLSYATAGTGGVNHFSSELFARIAGISLVHVPYKGGAPALVDVMSGQVQFMFGTLPLTLPHARAGRIKALGVSSLTRSPHLPQVPTVAEAGAPGYELETWWGLAVAAGVPHAIVQRLNAEIATILGQPEAAQRLDAAGAAPKVISSAEFARLVVSEIERWGRVARETNITSQ
jgi:tripartite-type tricarboxylate transporter receptor subunit TctC